MKFNRINEIEKYVQEVENVSLDHLCDMFKVSKNTIRRDIAELEKKGLIKKVYGGITINSKKNVEVFESREIANQDAKELIGKLAGDLVENGDVIFIDSGTTTKHIIPFLKDKENITIITPNLHVIVAALFMPNLRVISTGGELFREAYSFTGTSAIRSIENYNITKAFLASTGISLTRGATNISPLESETKKHIMANSAVKVLLIDHTKINIAALMTYAKLEEFDYFVSDQLPPEEYVEFFQSHNVGILTP
ncbi:DeoR/GlpR family DNA-binding transcription regulator [Propionispora vibrioides]|jgi:DeoR family myo-inositol catabolism operon transcriptional repressor|uniref:Transcriptional regulator, DeoR family n=1 Tax=Propionispora vibrioides TaxID=112903 RepID=A0A1H8R5H2_9FIRM|nr:DeoR/GlpR family DNA-binding transcription regulator [Propionispora vibrioides]SEO61642.1 transcriptional regulator, DeoR family [Propionispora vibrioides]